MAGRTIAIGDVHGCSAALDTLLREIGPDVTDTIVALGDYIDRGPSSREVIERLLRLADECKFVPLLGNHEAMLMMAREREEELDFWLTCGGRETLDSYGGELKSIPAAHFEFMDSCRASYETATHFFLHANYDAELPLEEQTEYVLLWKHLSEEAPPPHSSGKTAVVGHTPQLDGDILDMGHLICIDTFCFGTGWLTALDVGSRQVWQADREGRLRDTSSDEVDSNQKASR